MGTGFLAQGWAEQQGKAKADTIGALTLGDRYLLICLILHTTVSQLTDSASRFMNAQRLAD
jgi:hypothetical protein